MKPPQLFVEIAQKTLKASHENESIELPLERQPDGRLTASSKKIVVDGLRNFLKARGSLFRAQVYCSIDVRGVSLRRLSLPPTGKDEFQRLLLLQIESEFPLSPDELAWGYMRLPMNSNDKQELLVAAVKKEVIEDYQEILSACGANPIFTLSALARNRLCPQTAESYSMLDVGSTHSELTCFEKGVPTVSRIIFVGIQTDGAAMTSLSQGIKSNLSGKKLLISGSNLPGDFDVQLARSLDNGLRCERLGAADGEGSSAAVSGLKKFADENETLPLAIQIKQAPVTTSISTTNIRKWALRAALLVGLLLLWPYAEAILFKGYLAKKVEAYKAEADRLTVIDRELNFLQYLKQTQPPYLDALYLFSKSTPQGTRFDSLTMNGRGEVSLSAAFREGQQVTDFRANLIASGFYTNVTVEEQSPTPDRQRLNVKISGQWKPIVNLQSLAIGPTAQEIEQAKNQKSSTPGVNPGMTVSPGTLPTGVVLPAGVVMPDSVSFSPSSPSAVPGATPVPIKEAK